MTFFDQLYERLFSNQNSEAPMVYEPLVRSDQFSKAYFLWKKSGRLEEVLEMIERGYVLKSKDLDSKPDIHLLKGAGANGFAISFDPSLHKNDLSYLMEFFKEQMIGLGYKKSNADQMVKEVGNSIQSTFKYYLKPKISGQTPFNQRFGNVLIEEVLINGKPSYLKLVASTYNDANYSKGYPFNQLFNKILNYEL